MSRLSYGTQIRKHLSLQEAAAAAIARHSHFYTDVAGWLLRAEPVSYSYTVDPEQDLYGVTDAHIELFAFPVLRWTKYGARLKDIWAGTRERWVDLRPGAKQWASTTPAEAVRQLAVRRNRQIYVLTKKLERATAEQALANAVLNAESVENPL